MRRQCSWRKVKFSEKKERKEERRLETGRTLKVIFATIVTGEKSKVSFYYTFNFLIMNSFAERDKVKKRKNPKENSAQEKTAPAPKVQ